ncbi:MAG: hypothetical protein ACI4QL_05865, partial [Candidatus Fimimonas sp.]
AFFPFFFYPNSKKFAEVGFLRQFFRKIAKKPFILLTISAYSGILVAEISNRTQRVLTLDKIL